jgi:uncharacterized protein YdaU (DUF1376 family)
MHSYTRHLGDYAKDTKHLSLLEHGAYTVLMDWCYASERALPKDEGMLYRICGAFSKIEQAAVMSVLEEFFEATEDGWLQNRVEKELRKAHEKSGKAKSAALARWNADAMQTQSEGNADALQTQSEGNASRARTPLSSSNIHNPVSKPARRRAAAGKLLDPVFPADLPEGYAAPLTLWFDYKRERREVYTSSGWSMLIFQQLRFPASIVAQSVENSMSNNWAGLFTERVQNPGGSAPGFGPQKKGAAAGFEAAPAVRGTDAPEGWERAMLALWGDDWERYCAAWETMLPADQAQVRAWLKKNEGGAKP